MAKVIQTAMTIDRSRYDYSKTRSVDPKTGKLRARTSNGDAVAMALHHAFDAGLTVEKIAKANKLEPKGANPGQVRMNLGNMLRGVVRRHAADKNNPPAVIGELTVKKLDQIVSTPASVKEAEKVIAARAKEVGKQKAAKPAANRGKTQRSASRGKSDSSQTADAAT